MQASPFQIDHFVKVMYQLTGFNSFLAKNKATPGKCISEIKSNVNEIEEGYQKYFLDRILVRLRELEGKYPKDGYLYNDVYKGVKNLLENPQTHPTKTKASKEFTTSRQVLAIYYLMNYAKTPFHEVDNTNLARFTQFLTGREVDSQNITNTNIYKKWKNLFGKGEKKNIQDLRFVQNQFEKIGMNEVAKMIENDINA